MKDILYFINDEKAELKVALPYKIVTSAVPKDIRTKKTLLIILDESFLNRLESLSPATLTDKLCFIHFKNENKDNLQLVRKYGCFDYFTDEDKKENVIFKFKRVEKLLTAKKEINKLEKKLSTRDRKIEKTAFIDPATKCYNWRYFLQKGDEELQRAHTQKVNLSVVIIDIDYFRQINEVYGVKIGDAVIKEFVLFLQKNLRQGDLLFRWREDEFFIIFPFLSNEEALRVANRLKSSIQSKKFKYKNLNLNIKVSMGIVSVIEDNLVNIKDVISALSECLLIAKQRGGDMVLLYSHPERYKTVTESDEMSMDDLKKKVKKLNTLLTRDLLEMIYGFARAIEAKDLYTGKHVEDTALIAERIGRKLNLPVSAIENIKRGAVLHDLGKVGIDENILGKKGPLNSEERKIIETHPWIAAEILREIHSLRGAIPTVLYHHERYDGKGYPLGLKGEEIPLSARIVSLADVYQALTSDRPYRKAFSKNEALKIIKQEAGKQFDPKIVDVFLHVIKEFK